MARKSTRSTETAQTQNIDNAKQAVLDKAVGDILKRYGDGSIMRLGEAHGMVTEVIPTGSLSLDIALGVGGVGVDSSRRRGDARQIEKRWQQVHRHRGGVGLAPGVVGRGRIIASSAGCVTGEVDTRSPKAWRSGLYAATCRKG